MKKIIKKTTIKMKKEIKAWAVVNTETMDVMKIHLSKSSATDHVSFVSLVAKYAVIPCEIIIKRKRDGKK